MSRYPDLPVVLVHGTHRTARLEAALEWCLTAALGLRWAFEPDVQRFQESTAPWKLQYGGAAVVDCWMQPEGLLEGKEIRRDPPQWGASADWLALIFWMGSRMEEFHDSAPRDAHGRFDPRPSVPFAEGWLQRPVCEEWAFRLGAALLGADWPQHESRLKDEYAVQPTLDVDSAFAFKGKGAWRTGAALGRDLVQGHWTRARHRVQACRGRVQDPYDTYAQAAAWHKEYGMAPRWFFLMARFGPHDKGLPPSSKMLAELMRSLDDTHPGSVQWHPGYAAAADPRRLSEEYAAFTAALGRPPVASRQHYLRLVPGETRRQLLRLGIEEDHTEGHATCTGFRGGFSRSRRWYDLEREEMTSLKLCPFVAMDATLCRYMEMQPNEVPTHLAGLAQSVRAVGGTMGLLWHNESLATQAEWAAWGQVYPNVLQAVR